MSQFIRRHRAQGYAVVVAAWLAILGIGGVATRDFLALESAQARALVSEGQSAEARGDRSQAVLAFERARLLAPRSSLVRSTLARPLTADIGPSLVRAVSWITPREWSRLAVAFGWLAGLGAALAIARRGEGRTARRIAVGAGIAFAVTVGGAVESDRASRALAVVTGSTGILVSPYDGAGATGEVGPGAVVVVGSRYGRFSQVSGSEGAGGWVASGVLASVVGTSI